MGQKGAHPHRDQQITTNSPALSSEIRVLSEPLIGRFNLRSQAGISAKPVPGFVN